MTFCTFPDPHSLANNELCGLYLEHGTFGKSMGTYTAEGIDKLCEGLKSSSITSLKSAATAHTANCSAPSENLHFSCTWQPGQ